MQLLVNAVGSIPDHEGHSFSRQRWGFSSILANAFTLRAFIQIQLIYWVTLVIAWLCYNIIHRYSGIPSSLTLYVHITTRWWLKSTQRDISWTNRETDKDESDTADVRTQTRQMRLSQDDNSLQSHVHAHLGAFLGSLWGRTL